MKKTSPVLATAFVVIFALSGCTPKASSSPSTPPSASALPTSGSVAACAEEQTGTAGLLTFNQVWPSGTFAEGSTRVVSLNAAKCRKGADDVVCEQPFPWIAAQSDGLLGQIGARLWGQAELTGAEGSRTQNLRESIVLFATPQNDGINTLGTRASSCGLVQGSDGVRRGTVKGVAEEMHNLGRVQLILEFGGEWQPAEIEKVRKAAIEGAKTI